MESRESSVCRVISKFRIDTDLEGPAIKDVTTFLYRHYSLLSFSRHQLYNSEALPFTYGQYVVIELADKLYNYVTIFLCFMKVCLSHRLQAGTQCGLQHSLSALTACPSEWRFLCESMNLHPDKQLFQVAGTGDRTTDLCVTRPELYPYTTGDSYTANIYSGKWNTCKKCKSYKYLPCILQCRSVDFIVNHFKLVFDFFHCTWSSN